MVARVGVPLLIIVGALYTYFNAASYWTRFHGLSLAFAFLAYVAVMARGRLRDAAVIAASLSLGLAAVEGYFVLHYRTAIDTNTPGYSIYNPVLGWGPAHAGVYHHHKVDLKTGQVIVDTDYTIDEHLLRKVESATDAPTVAIGGGSNVFGSGIPDSATLPQALADSVGRRLHVVNLAFSGYGAQQYLRILETAVHDDVLKRMRAFVFVSIPEYPERAACMRGYTLAGPSYELVDGEVKFVGSCADRWALPLRWLFEITSLYDIVAPRFDNKTVRQKIDLYIAMLVRAGQLARAKYGAPTVILYVPNADYARRGGYTDDELIGRLRAGGLVVLDGALDQAAFPGQDLFIPGDGHPTAVANRELAARLVKGLSGIVSLEP
ncbi:MAG TPA: hypothetical protein VGR70_08665 [Stellaceae bacterium]|nr:hypothetical protein [Stellaceae bacterium]